MAAGETQLTDLPGRAVTSLGADQDGLTRPAGTRPTGRTTAVLPQHVAAQNVAPQHAAAQNVAPQHAAAQNSE